MITLDGPVVISLTGKLIKTLGSDVYIRAVNRALRRQRCISNLSAAVRTVNKLHFLSVIIALITRSLKVKILAQTIHLQEVHIFTNLVQWLNNISFEENRIYVWTFSCGIIQDH